MKRRIALRTFYGIVVACFFILCATALYTGYSRDPAEWLRAQRASPLLWLVDFCSLYTLTLIAFLIRAEKHTLRQAHDLLRLREDNEQRVQNLLTQVEELENSNQKYADKTVALEEQIDDRQEAFEIEARRLTEQAFRALQGQVDANTRQMDAVNLALQYHRAELSELRRHMRGLQSGDVPPMSLPSLELSETAAALLSPEEIALLTSKRLENLGGNGIAASGLMTLPRSGLTQETNGIAAETAAPDSAVIHSAGGNASNIAPPAFLLHSRWEVDAAQETDQAMPADSAEPMETAAENSNAEPSETPADSQEADASKPPAGDAEI